MTHIFDGGHGAVVRSNVDKGSTSRFCFIRANAATSELTPIFQGYAPVTSVTIQESVDYSTYKALSGNYLIASFGHNLVQINISGMHLYDDYGHSSASTTSNIQNFYSSNNLASNHGMRYKITMGTGNATGVFECVAVSLKLQASGGEPGDATYQLNLIGVQQR